MRVESERFLFCPMVEEPEPLWTASTGEEPWCEEEPPPPPAATVEMEELVVLGDRWRKAPPLSLVETGRRRLERGHHGAGVAALQIMLNAAGAEPALEVDGAFGPHTERAVRRLQAARGADTGHVDSECLKELVRRAEAELFRRGAFASAQLDRVAPAARSALLTLLAHVREPWKRLALAELLASPAFLACTPEAQRRTIEDLDEHRADLLVITQHRVAMEYLFSTRQVVQGEEG